MPSVAVLGLNRYGEQVYNHLTDRDDTDVLGVFTEPSQYSVIGRLEPDYIVSAGFGHILPDHVLEIPSEAAINLHPSYLPYNRGVNPDVWSIIRDDVAGVTIHYMTPEVDGGPILAREEVPVHPDDSCRDLRRRLDHEIVALFENTWDGLCEGAVDTVEQDPSAGTTNYSADFERICELDLNETVRVGDLLDRLRALTFPPYHNAHFEVDDETYYVRLSITPESELNDEATWDTPTLF